MRSELGHHLNGIECPDFTKISTGVGVLPIPVGMAAQTHMLHHNALVRGGLYPDHPIPFVMDVALEPRTAPQASEAGERNHPPKKKPPAAPLPPPQGRYRDFTRQWERLLAWATWRTLTDQNVMPGISARAAARNLARRISNDYGPMLEKWLGGH